MKTVKQVSLLFLHIIPLHTLRVDHKIHGDKLGHITNSFRSIQFPHLDSNRVGFHFLDERRQVLHIFLQFSNNTVVLIDEDMDSGIMSGRSINLMPKKNRLAEEESGEDTQKQNQHFHSSFEEPLPILNHRAL